MRANRGMTLLEASAYITVLVAVSAMAFEGFHLSRKHSVRLTRTWASRIQ